MAREAVRKSLVLLKNDKNLLPLDRDSRVFVAGKNANNLGHRRKTNWLRERYAEGLRYKVLRSPESGDVGMIEDGVDHIQRSVNHVDNTFRKSDFINNFKNLGLGHGNLFGGLDNIGIAGDQCIG